MVGIKVIKVGLPVVQVDDDLVELLKGGLTAVFFVKGRLHQARRVEREQSPWTTRQHLLQFVGLQETIVRSIIDMVQRESIDVT